MIQGIRVALCYVIPYALYLNTCMSNKMNGLSFVAC